MKKLENYKNSQFPILSLYVGVAQKKSPPTQLLLSQFRSLIHKNLSKEEKQRFAPELLKIESYLSESLNTRGDRSVAFFTGGSLWETIDLEFSLPPICLFSNFPYLEPIINAQKAHQKYLVLLVDRKKARMFTVHLGKIGEHLDLFDPSVPQRVRANEQDYYGRSDKIFRHIEDHLHRHLKLIASTAANFAKGKGINFILLGGHEELFSKMKKCLPQSLSRKILATFVTELNVPLNSLLLKSKKIAGQISESKLWKK